MHKPPAADNDADRREQVRDMLRPAVITDADEPQHDPSAGLARLVDLRDVHCAGPGCSHRRCDRDHLVRHPDGPTSAGNLGLLSRRCHSAKHNGWTLVRHPDGSTTWHSPLGRTYDRPGPWASPPRTDLWDQPPPRRTTAEQPRPEDDDTPLVERLGAPPLPTGPAADEPDEPPPF